MRLNADMTSPFTGNDTVFMEYIPESNDNMLLDIDTGYVTMDRYFNREIWEETMSGSEIKEYVDNIINDISPELQKHIKWVGTQLWVLIQMGYMEIQLFPVDISGRLQWRVEQRENVWEFKRFQDAYDKFNYLCNTNAIEEE